MELKTSSSGDSISVVKIGGIAFNKITVGRRRTVKFKVANPGPGVLSIQQILVHESDSSFSPSNKTPATIYNRISHSHSQAFVISSPQADSSPLSSPHQPNTSGLTFSLASLPQLPIILQPRTECECKISFTPITSGLFNSLLEIVPSPPHNRQIITLHGEGELATTPQQIIYQVSPRSSDRFLKEISSESPSESYIVSRTPFQAEDEDVDVSFVRSSGTDALSNDITRLQHAMSSAIDNGWNRRALPQTRLRDSWANKNLAVDDSSLQSSPSAAEALVQMERRLRSLEKHMETLLSLNTPSSAEVQNTRKKQERNFSQEQEELDQTLNNLAFEEMQHRSNFQSGLGETANIELEVDNYDYEDANFYEVDEENAQTLKMSESTDKLLKEMADEHAPPSPSYWKDIIRSSNDPYSPGFSNMAKMYAPTTPQIRDMYKKPDFGSPFWRDSPKGQPRSPS
eukprot:TRINITY_DN7757_c0_g1_i1.p1 TRINITY_DN7757_c0_g1~~TRINITY_DN7757_c0_g1_i1.p1  ORF type:complete len:457 (-),score=105.21 TRINITY_DN7757_c0_g1_i1:49-1419(-)